MNICFDGNIINMENHEYKLNLTIEEISNKTAEKLVIKHYPTSEKLPPANKHSLGVYINDNLEGVITLGYGTRPFHTIKKMFPSLSTKDYYEIGRMCINDDFKTNTESQMLSKTIKFIKKNYKEIKLLFTWANGLEGKIGTVYQASNFLYGGYITTECYVYNGYKLHPRGVKKLLGLNDNRITIRPTPSQKIKYGIDHISGMQFRYCYFTCGFSEKKSLIEESPFEWNMDYPKSEDLKWKKWIAPRVWVECEKPVINTDKLNFTLNDKGQMKFEDFV